MGGRKKRQTALTFTPLPSSSPAAKAYHKQIQDRAAAVRFTDSASPSPRKKRKIQDSDNVLPTPEPSSRQTAVVSIDSEDELLTQPPKSSLPSSRIRQKRMAQKQIDFTQARDPSTFDPPISLRSSHKQDPDQRNMFASASKRKRRRAATPSSEESGGDVPVITTRARAKSMQEPAKGHEDEDEDEEEEEDDDDVIPTSSRGRQTMRRTIVLSDDEEGAVQEQMSSNEDDMPTTIGKHARQRRQTPSSPIPSDGDDSDDDMPATPRRRSLKKRRITRQEQNDLNEDLDFFAPTSDDEPVSEYRSTQSARKDARQSALARLKAKRAGNTIVEEEDDEDTVGEQAPNSSKQMFKQTEEDEDFIESDDEDAPLGIPEGMPIEYTSYASAKAKDLFRYAVDWMVQRVINPAFSKDDALYQLAFRKLDDEVKGLASSKFTSSAWTSDFVISLNARPELAFQRSLEALQDKCDACNRTSHPATYEVQFQGKPYYDNTLEDVGNPHADPDDSDSSDEDTTSHPSYDAQGREVPSERTLFRLGKFCMANAQAAHALRHWRWHLASAVSTWLARNGYEKAEAVLERNRMSTKKRRKLSHKIIDRMESTGKMKDFYKLFKDNIAEARIAGQTRYDANSP